MTKALFIGRFQPFHKGHLSALEYIGKKADKVIVAIAVHPYDRDNPFSPGLRKKMLERSGVKHKIALVKDTKSDEEWANKIVSRFRPDIVFSNNPWTIDCFKGKVKVEKIPVEVDINATDVRRLMRENKNWKDFVPKGTVEVLEHV